MRHSLRTLLLATGISAVCSLSAACADAVDKAIPAATVDEAKATAPATETAVLAGGCFWGMQGVFEHVKGVTKVVAGYSGGAANTATYDEVTTETTGHAESVSVTFDPRQVSYGQILQIYFSVAHDPTELNRQGPDEGTSYRSDIFAATPLQTKIAKAYIAQLDGAHVFPTAIVTKVDALQGFYAAEDYHQDFLIHNPTYPYIVMNDLPKVAALKRVWPAMYRDKPVMLAAK